MKAHYTTTLLFIILSLFLAQPLSSSTSSGIPKHIVSEKTSEAGAQQDKSHHSVTVQLLDSLANEAIQYAIVSASRKGSSDESLHYSTTNANGIACITGLTEGEYTVKAELLGYDTYTQIVSISDRDADLGIVYLGTSSERLESAVVTAEANTIVVKNDTLEYSVSSVPVVEDDVLEDLLKKLPGVEIDDNGKITVGGKVIQKMTIDGKTFFLNDPAIALKNLPASIFDKVRMIEQESEQAKLSGVEDGETETVIDLKVKNGMLDGWFGNASGGYGTDDRYQAAGIAANITDDSQLAIIGKAGNTNNRGFGDVVNGTLKSLNQSTSNGGKESGITTSYMIGANGNKNLKNGKIKLQGDYVFSDDINDQNTTSHKVTAMTATTDQINDRQTLSTRDSRAHAFSSEMRFAPDSKTNILFKPEIRFEKEDYSESVQFETSKTGIGTINDGNSAQNNNSKLTYLSGRLLAGRKFEKKGRNISLSLNYSFSGNDSHNIIQSQTVRYNTDGTERNSSSINRKDDNSVNSNNFNARLSYTEPIVKKLITEFAVSFKYNHTFSEKTGNDWNDETGGYDILNTKYTNSYDNYFKNLIGEINLRYYHKKMMLVVGGNVQPSFNKSIGDTTNVAQNVVNYSPNVIFRLNMSRSDNIQFRYFGRTKQPGINQLQPVISNTNPLYIRYGNPDLAPEFTHNLSLEQKHSGKEKHFFVNTSLSAYYTKSKIISRNWYDSDGVTYSKPVNDNSGNYGARFRNTVYDKLGTTGLSVTNTVNASYSKGTSYVKEERNSTSTMNLSDYLRLSYIRKIFSLYTSANVSYSNYSYSLEAKDDYSVWRNTMRLSGTLKIPIGINIKTDFDYTFYKGFTQGFSEPAFIWNAEASWLFWKKKASLGLYAYDMLNQSNNIRRIVRDDYYNDIETNTLQRYILLRFTYRFGSFGKARKK